MVLEMFLADSAKSLQDLGDLADLLQQILEFFASGLMVVHQSRCQHSLKKASGESIGMFRATSGVPVRASTTKRELRLSIF